MIRPFGEAALLVELKDAGRAGALAASLAADPVAGVVELVPGLRSLLIELDPAITDMGELARACEDRLNALPEAPPAGRLRVIPVVYGGANGPDLPEVADLLGIAADEVIARHAATDLRVLFDGFAPGFAYLGDLPDELRVPRLATPRTRTTAGSVAIAGSMSGIYPAELPGGWRVIGRTPVQLFDPRRDPPAYLVAGDRVRFAAMDASEWDRHLGAPSDWR